MIFVFNSNKGKDERTKTLDSTEIILNKKDDDVSSEKRVSRNFYAAINHFEKQNTGNDKGLLHVEECIQDNVLIKNLLSSNKLGKFSTERRTAADDCVYPNLIQKMHMMQFR